MGRNAYYHGASTRTHTTPHHPTLDHSINKCQDRSLQNWTLSIIRTSCMQSDYSAGVRPGRCESTELISYTPGKPSASM